LAVVWSPGEAGKGCQTTANRCTAQRSIFLELNLMTVKIITLAFDPSAQGFGNEQLDQFLAGKTIHIATLKITEAINF